jgi:polyprenyl P-hydroxybenzoate/phenylacrylic acid decarboxylase-like protein
MQPAMHLVLCITGASGSLYAKRLSHWLAWAMDHNVVDGLRVSWVASSNAADVWSHELGEDIAQGIDARFRRWDRHDFRAPFASGSNAADAVIVAPCSMSALARVAHGGGDDLIARSCEVALKERRKLILVVRETPLSLVHLRNMVAVTEAGATVLPAIPSFYAGVNSLDAAIDSVVMRALDHAGLRIQALPRWGAHA